jgi:hypothetical protein
MIRMGNSGQADARGIDLRRLNIGLFAGFGDCAFDVSDRGFQSYAQKIRRLSSPFAFDCAGRVNNYGTAIRPATINA